MNFKGFIMSDLWAINTDSSDNFANGLDMNMPGGKDLPSTMVEMSKLLIVGGKLFLIGLILVLLLKKELMMLLLEL